MNKLLKQCPCCGRINVDDSEIVKMYKGAQLIRAGITENHIVERIEQMLKQQTAYYQYSRVEEELKNDKIRELTEQCEMLRGEIERIKKPSLWQRLKAKGKRHG